MSKIQKTNDEYWLSEEVTLADIIQLIEDNPELEPFLNKKIIWHNTDIGEYDANCVIRLSPEHDAILVDGESAEESCTEENCNRKVENGEVKCHYHN